MSTDMVKDERRLRYMDNNRIPKILINYSDLTILNRKIEIPLNKQDLLPKMMQRFENAKLEYKINPLSEADYKRNCIRLINHLNGREPH